MCCFGCNAKVDCLSSHCIMHFFHPRDRVPPLILGFLISAYLNLLNLTTILPLMEDVWTHFFAFHYLRKKT